MNERRIHVRLNSLLENREMFPRWRAIFGQEEPKGKALMNLMCWYDWGVDLQLKALCVTTFMVRL